MLAMEHQSKLIKVLKKTKFLLLVVNISSAFQPVAQCKHVAKVTMVEGPVVGLRRHTCCSSNLIFVLSEHLSELLVLETV